MTTAKTMAEVREIVDAVRDDEALTKLARTIKESISDARWQGLGEWDQARYAAHLLSAAGFGLVADAGAKALEDAAEDFESNVGVSEFSDQSVRDDCRWGHIEEAWEYQGPYMDWLRNRAAAVRGEG